MIRIRELRESQNLTQAELAAKLDISPSAIGMYEQNRRVPSVEILQKMSKIFGVTTDYILGSSNEKEIDLNNHYMDKAFALLEQMDSEQQKTAIRLLKALADENKE